MESYIVINYKWQTGVYDLKKMIQLVKNNNLTKEDFFEITRKHYDKIKNNY